MSRASTPSFSPRSGGTTTISGLEQNPYTVLAVAGARVYHAKLSDKSDNNGWTYSRWKGNLSFCRDIDSGIPSLATSSSGSGTRRGTNGGAETEKHWFRLADEETGRTVWMFRFPENFEYAIDRPFFHVFQGRTRRYGFLYNDDDEAALFGQKVISQIFNGRLPKKMKNKKSDSTRTAAARSKSLSAAARSAISSPAPNSFRHVTHIGVGKDGVFEASSELDDSWKAMLGSLQGYGPSEGVVIRHSDFVEGFWKGVEAIRGIDNESGDSSIPKDIPRKMTTITAF